MARLSSSDLAALVQRLALLGVLAMGGLSGAGTPALGHDRLTIGVSQFPVTFNPLIESMLAKTYVLAFTQRPMTVYDPGWRLVCLLCETVPTLENGLARRETRPDGGDGMAVTVTLRPGLAWDDGTPVTAGDIVLAWEVGRHPRSGVASAESFRHITAIEIHDPRRLTLHLDRVTFDYNALNALPALPAHIERRRFEAAPEEYRQRSAYEQDPTLPGLYNGPYRISRVERGSHILLEPNPHWPGPRPPFARILIRAVENGPAMEASLLSGGIDMIAGELGMGLEQTLAFERRHGDDGRWRVLTRPSLAYEHLEINLDSPILADRRIRRALLLAIDRPSLSRHLFEGRQPVAASLVPPLDWIHDDNLFPSPYDPAAAAALLDQAGWHPGADGIRINDRGEPLRLELLTTAGNRTRELVGQVIQANFRAIGVSLRLRTQPARVMFGDTVTRRKFPHLAMFAWYSAPESVPRSTLHSSMIPTSANSWSGQNYTGYANPDMDRLIEAIEIELDRSRRQFLWHRLQRLYADDLPVLPLYFRADGFVLPRGLTGLHPTGHQDPTPYWVEEWRWD